MNGWRSFQRSAFLALVIATLALITFSPPVWALSASPIETDAPIALETIIPDGLTKPLFVTHAGDGSQRLFVVEQVGRISIFTKGHLLSTPFLDIAHLLGKGGERGLLGLAFHPNYRENGRYVINYTRKEDGATVVAEFRVSSDSNRSETRENVLLVIAQPYSNHNGGMVAFGPDGYLYIGMGDGGAGGDPGDRGQNQTELLGKILRIDIDGQPPYGIPEDNPFAQGGGREEIFASGFRNPWRFSFDRSSGDLWVGDVGQRSWEEIDVVKVGENHGWRLMEGNHCFEPSEGCRKSDDLALPMTEYANAGDRCSVTGGYVYRGSQVPFLQGTYVFSDFCSGELIGFQNGVQRVLLNTDLQVSSFGEDEAGELYVINHKGSIHRIIEAPAEKP